VSRAREAATPHFLLRHPGEGLAKAGIHSSTTVASAKWIPAFAGMTGVWMGRGDGEMGRDDECDQYPDSAGPSMVGHLIGGACAVMAFQT
jgi:hypothetical protein